MLAGISESAGSAVRKQHIDPANLVVGMGFSHDASVTVVDRKTGDPLFSASLERMTRQKNDAGTPEAMLSWADSFLGRQFSFSDPICLIDDSFYSEADGYHAIERAGDIVYRWTKAKFLVRIQDCGHYSTLVLGLVPASVARQRLAAEVFAGGNKVATISNKYHSATVDLSQYRGEVTLEFRCIDPKHVPPDTRELGIMVRSLSLRKREENTHNLPLAIGEAPISEIVRRKIHKQIFRLPAQGRRTLRYRHFAQELLSMCRYRAAGFKAIPISELGNRNWKSIDAYDHHLSHAATAYYPSGFERALVVSLDGMGDEYSCRIFLGDNGKLVPLASYYYEEMPTGLNYEIITALLGFKPARHEGKITGLAAFGKANESVKLDFDKFFHDLWMRGSSNHPSYRNFRQEVGGLDRLRQLRQSRFSSHSREDIAYYIQERTEREVTTLIKEWHGRHPEVANIALTGGVFANVKVNQRVKELGFKRIFVQPAMSDAGLSFGAAILKCVDENGGTLRPYRLDNVFLGPDYSEEECRAAMEQFDVSGEWHSEETIASVIANFIVEGKVLAHFNGRMEYGPRALGNRSILYSASDPEVNQWLNKQLNRTEFMPFAPAIMADRAAEYFENIEGAEHTAEFMTITFDCTEKARREIPAAIHVDNTARPQFVTYESNPRFYRILQAYEKLTGIPCVINTSFNMHEEPIVATPGDAIRSYQQGNLDVLVLGNFIIQRR